jgi:hypothetical protein
VPGEVGRLHVDEISHRQEHVVQVLAAHPPRQHGFSRQDCIPIGRLVKVGEQRGRMFQERISHHWIEVRAALASSERASGCDSATPIKHLDRVGDVTAG